MIILLSGDSGSTFGVDFGNQVFGVATRGSPGSPEPIPCCPAVQVPVVRLTRSSFRFQAMVGLLFGHSGVGLGSPGAHLLSIPVQSAST